ncbi:MAG: inositol-3-phosphate synthase [Thermodesulfobacteriota bacterium]
MDQQRIGVWLIGALGSVSAAVILGALAQRDGLTDSVGMITGTEAFRGLGLVPLDAVEFGGCDIRQGSLRDNVRRLARDIGSLNPDLPAHIDHHLARTEQHIVRGSTRDCGDAILGLATEPDPAHKTLREEIADIMGHLARFKASNELDEVVVVNLASTEPRLNVGACHQSLADFETCLDRSELGVVRASTIYAYAAIRSQCPYVNFTPSNGALFPAMVELAEHMRVPVMGNDGKTGETLVKSVLAPLFVCRNLQVLSWEAFNILGNMDGRVLDHPENKASKVRSKDAILPHILGYKPHSLVNINYVPSLSDQKVAWDYIHFRGFLGHRMSLQFIWQGHDSILAAPLVLDLVRLTVLARNRGDAGLMPHLACFFKDPLGVSEHRLSHQFEMLSAYVAAACENPGSAGKRA